ncbi:hypothetical protein [Frankia sp. CiP3]|uniref:hypothetical protein n=1 Tax=Frankia sp. CiP3 TaxID=2880971 RepID=UPI001EF40D92|nr:hypothetical protein [Frankia sp. CiP3]
MVVEIAAFLLASVAASAVLWVTVLTVSFLVDWFQERAARVRFDADKAAVTVIEELASGKTIVVQGIFDKSANKFDESRKIEAGQVDPELRRVHSNHKVVIWS